MTTSPWTRTDAVLAAAVIAVGSVVWAIGWYRVADEGGFDAQIAPMNVAVLGQLVAVGGLVLWFLGGRRAVDYRRRALLGDEAAPAIIAAPVADVDSFVGAERLYHRPDCPMAQDRDWPAGSRVEQERAGRVPCGWCEP
jgi:hypothetical protein